MSWRFEGEQPANEWAGGLHPRSLASTATVLRVYLLGPPVVQWADQPLGIPRRQTRALLYRLAADLEPIPRAHLCFLFWPDIPESKSRRNLSFLLSHLRRGLPAPDLLLTLDDRIGLDPEQVWSDTVAFERLCEASHGETRFLQETWFLEVLQQAVNLRRGPFLAGFSLPGSPEFEAWASLEGQVWERKYLEALSGLIEAYTARSEYGDAIACAQRYLATDDLAEDVHRRLIELYAAAGDRRAAVQQFERCAIILERELSVSPLPETRAAYEAAVEGRPLPLQPGVPPYETLFRTAWTTLPSLDVPLVGRDSALRTLKRAYARARSGHGGMVLLSGEPGIGKSRLLQEFVSELEGEATLLVGSGHEAEQGFPYWPLVETLRPHLPAIDWTALDVEPFSLAEVARLLPELRTLLPDLPDPHPVEPAQAQGRLFQALAHCLLSMASQRLPLVLCLDNLHWADTSTLSWLGYLARHLKPAPVLMLGCYRTEGAARLASLRAGLHRLDVLDEMRLDGLRVPDVLHLIWHLSGRSSGAERFSQRLHRETGGNPFFLLEILRTMFEAGILRQDETGWSMDVDKITEDYGDLPLPDTVSEAIQDRLGRLSPRVCQVLEAGAVIGRRFDYDLVWNTSGRREREVVDALDALSARQVISAHGGRYQFSHDLIRAVVYRDLSYGRRRLLHRRAGEALERLRPDDVVALARHFEQAEQVDKAVRYLLEAGERAVRVFANDEAIAHFTRGLRLLEELPDSLERTRQELMLQVSLAVPLQAVKGYGDPELGRICARAQELCQQVGETPQLFPVLAQLIHFYGVRGELHASRELAEQLLRLAERTADPLLVALAHLMLGEVMVYLGELAEAHAHLEHVIAFYDLQQHHGLVYLYGQDPGVASLNYASWALWSLGYPEQALKRAGESLALAQELSTPLSLVYAQTVAGSCYAFCQDWQKAQESAEACINLSTEQGFPYWLAGGILLRGWALAGQGQAEEGVAQIRQGLTMTRATGSRLTNSIHLAILAETYGRMGQVEEGLTTLVEALAIAHRGGEHFYEAEIHRIKGELLLRCIEPFGKLRTAPVEMMQVEGEDQAESCFQRAIEVARQQGAKSLELRAAMSLGRLWQRQGKVQAARQMLAEIYGWFTEGFDTPDLKEAKVLLSER